MVPLPAQGHLNQLLHLSRRIAAHGIPVHYAGAATHLRQAKLRLQGPSSTTALIHFQEFPISPFQNPPPNPHAPTKFPSQIMPSLNASLNLRAPVSHFVKHLSAIFRRVVVIHDSLMCYVVQDMHAIPGVDCYTFRSISAFSVASWENDILSDSQIEANILKQIPSLDGYYPPEFGDFLSLQVRSKNDFCAEIYNSTREIEGFCLDLMEKRRRKYGAERIWALGPFNPVHVSEKGDLINNVLHECLYWLDKQGLNKSVIFVSFGTTCSFSDEQIKEIAVGLERSEHKFIWVLREADKGDIFEGEEVRKSELPEGFEKRVRKRGIVVRDWAPQLEILGHPSTGGFVSHCGWNSCLESISMGVPIATWPQHSDQPANAVLITKVLKIGVEMKQWTRRDELLSSSRIEKVVRRLMESSEGDEIRKRAAQMGKAIKNSMMEGGNSQKEMDLFISHITR
ncbi:zeatin o-glucosyltransferase [Phtheirospermum japonicum]|uniref:Glycosyltransferase n=1 Tax=Phtheirospermum japonicum TaxID=374723 RepID=A0A830BZE0_9LAMI|nr:zeatin o-glucosyltransferase [Phtheirospermum japonicum]